MNIFDLPWCLHEALEHDLPGVQFPATEVRGYTRPAWVARPHHVEHPIDVYSWEQSWSDTSLGMGGMAGQAITSALTTVVVDREARVGAVYVGRRLRGLIDIDSVTLAYIAQQRIITGLYPVGLRRAPEAQRSKELVDSEGGEP